MPILPATILFVDDDKLITDTQQELLSLAGYDVEVANSAKEALEILNQMHIDLVFTDLNMPAENGYWLADQVAKNFPDVCIVLATGYASFLSDDAARYSRYPLILKPYTLSMTTEFFDAALSGRVLPPARREDDQ